MGEVVPTACTDWSLNEDSESKKLFWWNNTYSISIWNSTLKLAQPYQQLDDEAVWRAFIQFQSVSVYKLCPICRLPEGNADMKVCCYCGQTVHIGCSTEASVSQMEWKTANRGFEPYLRACFLCEGVEQPDTLPQAAREACSTRRASIRALSICEEYPAQTVALIENILRESSNSHSDDEEKTLMASLRRVVTKFFQSDASCAFLRKEMIKGKGGGVGVVAAEDIPAYTIVGVYPGYIDALCGEQVKQGRPIAKYALMDLNCADYYNVVFEELQDTFTPFINEPCETEASNCGWIQEKKHAEGRLSVMTTRKIMCGEELLIGYGPLYPRTYPYCYDALTFHLTETQSDIPCFALWHWLSTEENDAQLECYVGYDEDSDSYFFWESAQS